MRIGLSALLTIFLLRPCGAAPGPYDPPIPEPANAMESIYRHYGTGCFGIDWRILRAMAQEERAEDPLHEDDEFVGVFNLRPGTSKNSVCGRHIRPFRKIFKCGELEEPELNTGIAAHRLHRLLTAEELRGRNRFKRDKKILRATIICKENTVTNTMVLAYLGLINGPKMLQEVLQSAKKDPEACVPGAALEDAVASFYENHKLARIDGRYRKGRRLADCEFKDEIIGRKSYRCVDAALGLRRYKKALRKARSLVLGSGPDRIMSVYPRHALDHAFCPPLREERPGRLFGCRYELSAAQLETKGSPCP